jgi:hypothetical protein
MLPTCNSFMSIRRSCPSAVGEYNIVASRPWCEVGDSVLCFRSGACEIDVKPDLTPKGLLSLQPEIPDLVLTF